MTENLPGRGSLIALEGSGGRSMSVALRQLERAFRPTNEAGAGASAWDASAIFFQVSQSSFGIAGATPRTILLLYAADLAFRLRWQIRPALESGAHVIAAPYLETPIAFGIAAGLSRSWLDSLFEFAPRPDRLFRVPERTIPVSRRGAPADSFIEFSFAQLRGSRGIWNIEAIRAGFDQHLDRLEASGECRLAAPPLRDLSVTAG